MKQQPEKKEVINQHTVDQSFIDKMFKRDIDINKAMNFKIKFFEKKRIENRVII